MYTAKIENSSGEVLNLTGNEPVYQVLKISGLNPPQAQINMSTIVGLDGAKFNSAKLNTRNLVLTIKINGNVEQNRLNLYSYFPTKEPCKFYYSNASVNVYIEGYVENVECDYFTNSEIAQISIICPQPYFKSLTELIADSSNVFPQFEFPFSINMDEPVVISDYEETTAMVVYNASETSTGAVIEIIVKASVGSIELKNTVTAEDFKLIYSFVADDKIIINTNKGQKNVQLIRGGVITNLFSALQQGSVFIQLVPGANRIEYLLDGGSTAKTAAQISFRYSQVYRGV